VAKSLADITPRFENPFADRLPSPSEVVDSYFAFVGRLHEANKAFSQRMAAAWEGTEGSKTTKSTASKSTGSATKSTASKSATKS